MTILYQLTGECPRDHARREFNWCKYQEDRCYRLQDDRRRTKDGAAVFYQLEARRWHILAMDCRARYNEAIAAIIPGTTVRWDDFFHIDRPFYVQQFGRAQRGPRHQNDALKLAASSAYGKWKTIPDPRPRSSHYQTPSEKYNDPRDVPLTLTEQMRDLIDGIGTKRPPILCIFPKCTNDDVSLEAFNKCDRCKHNR